MLFALPVVGAVPPCHLNAAGATPSIVTADPPTDNALLKALVTAPIWARTATVTDCPWLMKELSGVPLLARKLSDHGFVVAVL